MLILPLLPAAVEPAAAAGPAQPGSAKGAGVATAQPAAPATVPATPPAQQAAPAQPDPLAASGLPVVLSPSASAEEVRHVAALDQAIAPVRELAVSADDAQRVHDAVAAFAANDPAKGRALAGAIADPVARKLVDWFRLRAGIGEAAEYRAFLDRNPTWPNQHLFAQRAEEALFSQGGSAQAIKAFFAKSEPQTGIGFAALASAFQAEGDEAKATELARRAWRDYDIPSTFETGFLARFGKLLGEADHKRRFDRLTSVDIRWTGERNDRAAVARRVLPLLSPPERQKAEARLAVFLRAANAQQLMAALPAETTPDWGLAYHRVQLLRRAGRVDEAAGLIATVPADPKVVANLDEWWDERRAVAYLALAQSKPAVAYEVVKTAGPLGVNALKDKEATAGWLALRYLGNAKAAAAHFEAMRKAADGPLSMAKADYWLGRTAETLGDKAKADEHFKAGAKYQDTFFGQLCRARLGPEARALSLGLPARPTPAEIAAFNSGDAIKAAVIAHRARLDPAIARSFLIRLHRDARSEGEAALINHLAEAMGDFQLSVRLAKLGVGRGQRLFSYSYPLHPMPNYKPLRPPPETALLLAIARQETEFNPKTVSGAGARGILQVMPVTARHVCRDYRVKCDLARLLTDPSYNTTIASAYITDRMAEFQGSYVLTFAGYNAGPGRARQWIREFGDPRDPKVDPIDWIMRIPFEETREYVQKVMSNVQVYRARLAGNSAPLAISADLARARGAAPPPAAPSAAPPPADETFEPRGSDGGFRTGAER